MKEKKFRARNRETKEWRYASFSDLEDLEFFLQMLDAGELEFNTLGGFISIKDKNDKEIYEGDILNINSFIGKVVLIDGEVGPCVGINAFQYAIKNKDGIIYNLWNKETTEVISNIYDNPELMR